MIYPIERNMQIFDQYISLLRACRWRVELFPAFMFLKLNYSLTQWFRRFPFFFGKAIIRKESYKTRFPGVQSIDRPSVNVVSNFEICPNIGGHLAAVKRLSIVMDTVMMTP